MSKSSSKPLVESEEHSEKNKTEPHLRFFLILNAIVGHSFAIKVLGIKQPSFKFYLFYINFVVCHLLLFGYSLAIFAHIYGSLEELEKFDRKIENLAFTACGSFGVFLVLARICCMIARDSKITQLFKRLAMLEERIISAAAKKCLIAVTIISVIFCSVMVAGTIAGLNLKSKFFNNRLNICFSILFNILTISCFQYIIQI
jgi:hypothetical protein